MSPSKIRIRSWSGVMGVRGLDDTAVTSCGQSTRFRGLAVRGLAALRAAVPAGGRRSQPLLP